MEDFVFWPSETSVFRPKTLKMFRDSKGLSAPRKILPPGGIPAESPKVFSEIRPVFADFVIFFLGLCIFSVKCQKIMAICAFYYQKYPFTFWISCATIYLVRVANWFGNVFRHSPAPRGWLIYKETVDCFCAVYINFTVSHKVFPVPFKNFSMEVITKWHRKFSL